MKYKIAEDLLRIKLTKFALNANFDNLALMTEQYVDHIKDKDIKCNLDKGLSEINTIISFYRHKPYNYSIMYLKYDEFINACDDDYIDIDTKDLINEMKTLKRVFSNYGFNLKDELEKMYIETTSHLIKSMVSV